MEFERVTKSNVPKGSRPGTRYGAIWEAVEALGDSGDAIAIRGMTAKEVQSFRSAARFTFRNNKDYRVSARWVEGVLYVTREPCENKTPPVRRAFAAVGL
jgi:hypothetical protein